MTSNKKSPEKEETAKMPEKEKQENTENNPEMEMEELKNKIEQLEKENKELTDNLKRLAAEYDNYRKRTVREKDDIYKNSTASLLEAFLPVFDNMELAKENADKNAEKEDLQKGIELIYRQFREVLDKLDIDEIECIGENFDPELHNAVMHITDDKYGENEVIEVLKKGYIFKDKVIRHSMVKVAN